MSAIPTVPASVLRQLKLGLLLLFVFVIARVAWLSDDAFITFRTVRNFVEGYGLTWNPDERVQAYTHPLWMLLMSAAYFCTREIFLTAILVSLVVTTAAVASVLFRLRLDVPRSFAFIALLLLSQSFRDYSSSGLENPLSFLLIATFCISWFAHGPGQRPLLRLFVLGGLLVLNRQDCVLLVFPALALELWRQRSWMAFRAAILGLSPLFAWELFSLVYYGFPFPNTYYAKLYTGISAHDYRVQGLTYYIDTLNHDPTTLLIVALGFFSAITRRASWPLALGLLLYLAYVVNIGGDFMQGRFFAVPVFLSALLLCRSDGEPLATPLWQPLLPALLAGVLALVMFVEPHRGDPLIRANGIADERQYYFEHNGLTVYRRGLRMPENHPWAEAGIAMRNNPTEHVFTQGVIGMIGYVSGPKVHIVDYFALADPLLARLPVAPGWRIGHFERLVPEGYLDTLRSDSEHIANPAIARLYDLLKLVTRGPLFTWERWRAIWALNVGGEGQLSEKDLQHLAVVPASRMANTKPEGYAWDGRDVLQIDSAGLEVVFDTPQYSHALSTSLDNNDTYLLDFYDGAQPLGEVTIAPVLTHVGLVVHRVIVPTAAAEHGWDRVRIRPQGGDNRYAIGHLIPIPD